MLSAMRCEAPGRRAWALIGDGPEALLVHVVPMSGARRASVDEHAEADRRPSRGRTHDEVHVARVEPVDDPPARLVRRRRAALERPRAGEGPLVERQPRGSSVHAALIEERAAG